MQLSLKNNYVKSNLVDPIADFSFDYFI